MWSGWVGEQVDTLKGATLAGEADLPRKLGVDERRLKDDFALATSVSALRTGVSIIQAVEDGTSLTEAWAENRRTASHSTRTSTGPLRDSAYSVRLRGGRRQSRGRGFPRGEVRPVRRGKP